MSAQYKKPYKAGDPSIGFEGDERVLKTNIQGKPLDATDNPDTDRAIARLRENGFGRKEGTLTLPQVLSRVQGRINDYANLYANNKDLKRPGPMGGDFRFIRTPTPRQHDMVASDIELKDIVGFECSQRKDKLNVSNLIAEWVRNRPGLLNNPANREWFGMVMADWLEAAHFGESQHRVNGLLPRNRKAAAAIAREALRILSKGERGSPPRYPAHILAGIVHEIQEAFRPIKKAWAFRAKLEHVRTAFGEEVKDFNDRELRSLVTDSLTTVAARLAEKVTGISQESFETAWARESEARRNFPPVGSWPK